jgi:phospholipid/cholesterol/gamma-HCH transport system substrate-binding protein/paraquat-inducible protein B
MSAKANYFKIGVFVISAAIIAIIAIIALGAGSFFKKKIMLETYMPGSVQGLDVGSPFKYRGVKMGNVVEITFVGTEYKFDPDSRDYLTYGQHVLVKIAIEPARDVTEEEQRQLMERMIAKGLRVRLAAQGITGVAYLEADYVDPERYPLPEIKWEPKTYYVPSVPSTISELTVSVDKILIKLEEIDVKGITDDVETTLEKVTKTLEDMNMKKISKQVESLLVELRETNKKTGPLLSDASKAMSLTLDELPDIIAQTKRTLRMFNNFVSSEEQNFGVSTENVRVITGNLRDLTENARRYPSLLMFGDPPPHSYPGGKQQ